MDPAEKHKPVEENDAGAGRYSQPELVVIGSTRYIFDECPKIVEYALSDNNASCRDEVAGKKVAGHFFLRQFFDPVVKRTVPHFLEPAGTAGMVEEGMAGIA